MIFFRIIESSLEHFFLYKYTERKNFYISSSDIDLDPHI